MIKSSLSILVLIGATMGSTAYAADCKKTLMGRDCVESEKGVSSHMRGNAVANAHAAKALKLTHAKAKAKAKAVAMSK